MHAARIGIVCLMTLVAKQKILRLVTSVASDILLELKEKLIKEHFLSIVCLEKDQERRNEKTRRRNNKTRRRII